MKLGITQVISDPAIRKQFEDLIAGITTTWAQEHGEDGKHSKTLSQPLVCLGGGSFVQPSCFLLANVPQATVSGVGSTVQWRKPSVPNAILDAGYDTAVPPYLANNADTIPVLRASGLYLVVVHIKWGAAAAGERYIEITHSQATTAIAWDGWTAGSANGVSQQLVSIIPVPYTPDSTTGVAIYVDAIQTSGGGLNIVNGNLSISKFA